MMHVEIPKTALLVVITIALLGARSVWAAKPSWAEGGKHDKHRQKERHFDRNDSRDYHRDRYRHGSDRLNFNGGRYFIDRQRTVIHDYYSNEYRIGRCPPGLFKKHNGCMPPGQAKKWVIGRPLPHDVVYYDLPPYLAMGIGLPPPGYRFVRVASDILMIAIGTGMVMDAIYDLGMR